MHCGSDRMIILYSSRSEVLKHWQAALGKHDIHICQYEQELLNLLSSKTKSILVLEVRQHDDIEDFLAFVKEKFPLVDVMLLSNKPNYAEGFPLLKLGIKAYANTYMASQHLSDAIDAIQAGNTWLYPEFIQIMIGEISQQSKPLHVKNEASEKLTSRERQIAFLVKEGLGNKEIALKTNITERTVKAHLSAIYEKLGIKDRISLALLI